MNNSEEHIKKHILSGRSQCASKVGYEVKRGRLKPAREYSCVDCDKKAQVYDHRDYNFPLKVEPVCRSCNHHRGKAIPKKWREEELLSYLQAGCQRYYIAPWAEEYCIGYLTEYVLAVERLTDGQVTRYKLRPDVFGNGK